MRQVSGFLGTPDSSTNKTDLHDLTEILLNVEHHNPNAKPYHVSC